MGDEFLCWVGARIEMKSIGEGHLVKFRWYYNLKLGSILVFGSEEHNRICIGWLGGVGYIERRF